MYASCVDRSNTIVAAKKNLFLEHPKTFLLTAIPRRSPRLYSTHNKAHSIYHNRTHNKAQSTTQHTTKLRAYTTTQHNTKLLHAAAPHKVDYRQMLRHVRHNNREAMAREHASVRVPVFSFPEGGPVPGDYVQEEPAVSCR